MTKVVELVKMNKKQMEAYKSWKTKKAEISDLQKQISVLEKEKKAFVEVFDKVFTDKNTAVIGPGGIKVLKVQEPREVKAYSYTLTQYKEG